jgi:hypothetical protein
MTTSTPLARGLILLRRNHRDYIEIDRLIDIRVV